MQESWETEILATGKRRPSYGEGDWFAVPLRTGGFASGLIARGNRKSVLFGYFFGPMRPIVPSVLDLIALKPEDSIFQARFGDLGLFDAEWPLIGHSPVWDRNLWPMPAFLRKDCMNPAIAEQVVYSDDDPNIEIQELRCNPADIEFLPEDGLWGSGAIEIRLSRLLT